MGRLGDAGQRCAPSGSCLAARPSDSADVCNRRGVSSEKRADGHSHRELSASRDLCMFIQKMFFFFYFLHMITGGVH